MSPNGLYHDVVVFGRHFQPKIIKASRDVADRSRAERVMAEICAWLAGEGRRD